MVVGPLGSFTIVGSASFNLFVISNPMPVPITLSAQFDPGSISASI